MKTLYKYTIFAGIATLLYLQSTAQSEFVLQLNSSSSYHIYWDNTLYHKSHGNLIVSNIFEGNHYLKIFKFKKSPHPYGVQSIKKLIYEGTVYIPSHTRTVAHLNQYGQLAIIKQEPLPYYEPSPYPYYNKPMGPVAFRQLIDVIDDATFDSNKLQIAEQATQRNYFTARQIATITELFGFESSRVKFAKTAYHSCIDEENYFLVYKAFNFSSSIDELTQFINETQY